MSGSVPPLPGVYNDSFTFYLQYAASFSSHMLDVLRSSYKTSFNVFVLFKGRLDRIHENGHLSSSDCSCYDLQKNCYRIRYDVQSIL